MMTRQNRRNRLRYREPRFNNRTSTKPECLILSSLQHKIDAHQNNLHF
ncbi:MAG: RRXRR domain-containing protein [Desulfovibrionaceae bacterium]|nr:RRXRR domain-containing protein [Desulfovibrionaceae bacterium]